ncbi:MAG: GIY-YIG nuclease family protein [Chitinophagaceae bacterium]|nr:GIY-YIG nuclease family protein [Chitinophagaceae bacterium]MCW5929659.1 GIY-YIG nuclease family protein [Chitinophagaceae bacterium]
MMTRNAALSRSQPQVGTGSSPPNLRSGLGLSGAFEFMAYYVYIIRSLRDGSFYKGYSENPLQRLTQHNNKVSQYAPSYLCPETGNIHI